MIKHTFGKNAQFVTECGYTWDFVISDCFRNEKYHKHNIEAHKVWKRVTNLIMYLHNDKRTYTEIEAFYLLYGLYVRLSLDENLDGNIQRKMALLRFRSLLHHGNTEYVPTQKIAEMFRDVPFNDVIYFHWSIEYINAYYAYNGTYPETEKIVFKLMDFVHFDTSYSVYVINHNIDVAIKYMPLLFKLHLKQQ